MKTSDTAHAKIQAHNCVELVEETARRLGSRTATKSKIDGVWRDGSWTDFVGRVRAIADGLTALGIKPGDRVAIIANTSLEFALSDFGVMGAGAVVVPIYQSNPAADVRYILGDSGASWVMVDTDAQADKVHAARAELAAIKGVIRFAGACRNAFEKSLTEIEKLGREWRATHEEAHAARVAKIKADDTACLLYTSGTTGNPKGVILTHGNWVYEAQGVAQIDVIREDDTLLLFLPLAHSFARVIETAWIGVGATMAFAESTEKAVDNAGEVKPTVIPAVPRIFEKAFANVVQKGHSAPGLKGHLFKMAMQGFEGYSAAREAGKLYSGLGFTLGKALVFPKVSASLRERFGGRLRVFVSGGAPLSPKIARFFELLGVKVLEGYGLTETSAGTCINLAHLIKIGTVGPPFPGTEIRIAEDGEILVKGGGVMKGYYNNPGATAEVLKDGWFATGDIGHLDADNYLAITDRKKDIIVTAGGKNVAPQNLENELKTDAILSQVVVLGDKRKYLSALVTLNPETAKKWASDNGLGTTDLAALATNPRMQARVQQAIDAVNSRQPSYSTIKKFSILPQDFSQESGEITPTLKVKRKFCAQKYKSVIDSMYTD